MKKILVLMLLVLMTVWSGGILQVTCLRIAARLKAANVMSFESPEIWVFEGHKLQDAEWEEEGEEFTLKGRMFDVLFVETIGQQKIYHCYFDHFETSVVSGEDLNDDALLNRRIPHHKNARDNVPLYSVDLFIEDAAIYCCLMNDGIAGSFKDYRKQSEYYTDLEGPVIPPEITG